MKAVVYLRVSTSKQERDGMSLASQENAARQWARARNVPVQVFRDVASGSLESRTGWTAALEALEPGDALVVSRLDRAARTIKQAVMLGERLQRDGVELVSLHEAIDTTSPAGRLFFHVMAALAQFEREQTRERVLSHNAARRRDGKPIAGTPRYGSRSKREQAAATVARELRKDGMTLAAIGEELGRRGYEPRGRCWYPQTVRNLVAAGQAGATVVKS